LKETDPTRGSHISRTLSRRGFFKKAGLLTGFISASPILFAKSLKPDIRVETVSISYAEHLYRAPVKFGNSTMDRATILTVHCTVSTRDGRAGAGFGSMPFNHIFSFPSTKLSHEAKNLAMKALAEEIAKTTQAFKEFGHPLEINWTLAPAYFQAAREVSKRLHLPDPIPQLCTLVTASAFDAALHDAYGKVNGLSSFQTLGSGFLNYDLARYLGREYRGTYPERYISRRPKRQMPLCHLISAIDPIEQSENTNPLHDGLPETMPEWIDYNGLVEFKIKLLGESLEWDVERVIHIDTVVSQTQQRRGASQWHYLLDFNEKCPNVEYFTTFLHKLKERAPRGFQRIRYVEQPTSRDLRTHPEQTMHAVGKLCPVVIDESLIDIESLLLAKEMGWNGAVVKSPKGLSHMILVSCVARHKNMLLAGGDMSCPGAALIQTANFQARIPTISAIEANARQYLPQANKSWEDKFPGMFKTKNGMLETAQLSGLGLGA
jgi:L-alanine-DL-glutamate epimerase-like enolase superfamily enzyme